MTCKTERKISDPIVVRTSDNCCRTLYECVTREIVSLAINRLHAALMFEASIARRASVRTAVTLGAAIKLAPSCCEARHTKFSAVQSVLVARALKEDVWRRKNCLH